MLYRWAFKRTISESVKIILYGMPTERECVLHEIECACSTMASPKRNLWGTRLGLCGTRTELYDESHGRVYIIERMQAQHKPCTTICTISCYVGISFHSRFHISSEMRLRVSVDPVLQGDIGDPFTGGYIHLRWDHSGRDPTR